MAGAQPTLTPDQQSRQRNLAELVKMLENFILAKCPEGRAAEVLEFTLRHWPGFVKAAEHDAGAFKTPARPELGFLLRFAEVAVNHWNAGVQLIATKPNQHAAPTVGLIKPGILGGS